MRRGHVAPIAEIGAAHLGEPHPHAAPRQLPRRLAAGQPAADYVDIESHGAAALAYPASGSKIPPAALRSRGPWAMTALYGRAA